MKKYGRLFYIIFITLFFSCQSPCEKSGDFKLLPLPQQFEITGVSTLDTDDIRFYYSPKKIELPVVGELLQNIQAVEKRSDAQIIFGIDKSLEIKAEGYILDISRI